MAITHIGSTVTIEGVEFEIVWAGGEGLTANRETKIIQGTRAAEPEVRAYNKTGRYAKKSQPKEPTFPEPDPSTEYCGVELVGGWCKRRRGHELTGTNNGHACS